MRLHRLPREVHAVLTGFMVWIALDAAVDWLSPIAWAAAAIQALFTLMPRND